jgi:hypothetical protein
MIYSASRVEKIAGDFNRFNQEVNATRLFLLDEKAKKNIPFFLLFRGFPAINHSALLFVKMKETGWWKVGTTADTLYTLEKKFPRVIHGFQDALERIDALESDPSSDTGSVKKARKHLDKLISKDEKIHENWWSTVKLVNGFIKNTREAFKEITFEKDYARYGSAKLLDKVVKPLLKDPTSFLLTVHSRELLLFIKHGLVPVAAYKENYSLDRLEPRLLELVDDRLTNRTWQFEKSSPRFNMKGSALNLQHRYRSELVREWINSNKEKRGNWFVNLVLKDDLPNRKDFNESDRKKESAVRNVFIDAFPVDIGMKMCTWKGTSFINTAEIRQAGKGQFHDRNRLFKNLLKREPSATNKVKRKRLAKAEICTLHGIDNAKKLAVKSNFKYHLLEVLSTHPDDKRGAIAMLAERMEEESDARKN